MKGRVIVNILTPSRLVSKEEGNQILEKWVALVPQYAPERYGGYEPIRSLFDPENIDAAVSDWDFSFLVTRRKPKMMGTVFMGNSRGTTHGWINIAFEYQPDLFPLLKQFFMEICTGFEAEFAFMHLMPGKQDLTITTQNDNVLVRSSRSNRNNRLKTDVIEYAYGGVFADLRALVDNQIKDVPTASLVHAAHFLVDYQISKTPEASGYPIEIVEITAKGKVSLTYCDPRCSQKTQSVISNKRL